MMDSNFVLDLVFSISFLRMVYYFIGEPGSEDYNPKAIFAGFTPWFISKLYNIKVTKPSDVFHKYSNREFLVATAKQQGGIASAFGTCFICFSFWVLLFIYFIPTHDIVGFFIIQFINKILYKWT